MTQLRCVDSSSGRRTVAIGFPTLGSRVQDSVALEGMQMAVDLLNAEVPPSTLHFVIRTPSIPGADPVRAAAQLRDDPEVIGVVGPVDSQEMLDAAAEYGALERAARPPVVAIAFIASSKDLSGISPWIFRLAPTDSVAAAAAAHFAFDSLERRRAAVFYQNDAYGRDWSRAFRAEFGRLGGTVVAREPFFDRAEDWRPVSEYARVIAADLVVLPSMDEWTVNFLEQLLAAGVDQPIISGDAGWRMAGLAHNRRMPTVFCAATFSSDDPQTAEVRRFAKEFRRRFPNRPGLQSPAFAFDATLTIGRAALAVGPDRGRIRAYIEALGAGHPPLTGVTGAIGFDKNHDVPNRTVRMTQVRP